MFVVAGLGNPGSKFANSRHNVGFMLADILFEKLSFKRWSRGFDAHFVENKDYIIVKPKTYMNLSGKSLLALKKEFDLETESFIIIYDDITLPLGYLRIRKGGQSGGHNGVKSAIECLGNDFIRVRIGVGGPKGDLKDYVLEDFSISEKKIIEKVILRSVDGIIELIKENKLEKVMNDYNGMVQ